MRGVAGAGVAVGVAVEGLAVDEPDVLIAARWKRASTGNSHFNSRPRGEGVSKKSQIVFDFLGILPK